MAKTYPRCTFTHASVFACFLTLVLLLAGCGTTNGPAETKQAPTAPDESAFLVAVEEEPDTTDFQCTSIHYTIATNVFDRLVEMVTDDNGVVTIEPSLVESWEESADGRTYTFHLRDNVTFSNGSPLTTSDVYYTFVRLLTHPDSCNQDIVEVIEGAEALEAGETDVLAGFEELSDKDFTITLEQPFEAFLACLTMPGASILDEETTTEAADLFGTDPAWTIGTGPFVFDSWERGEGMRLVANPDCWSGSPRSAGLDLRFITDPEEVSDQFENGELDILDLDDLGNSAEFYIHGDIYQDRIHEVPQIGISYIALNEAVKPLDDVRVRQALQLALDRHTLLDVVYSGRGQIENGIYSHGLYGFNQDLPEIPCDRERAQKLLAEAGYPDGIDITFAMKSSSTQSERALANQVVDMWAEVGVRATIELIDEDEFMRQRKAGELPLYTATWTADYNDPDNYIYTFFGSRENTAYRSLNYADADIIDRVRKARMITDSEARLKEYQDLEETIVQKDAAWIPLFSRTRLYVTSERLGGFRHAWNGSVKNVYRYMSVDGNTDT